MITGDWGMIGSNARADIRTKAAYVFLSAAAVIFVSMLLLTSLHP
jgi:hypothetical protein